MTQPYRIVYEDVNLVDLNILENTYPEYTELVVDCKKGQVVGVLKEAPSSLYRYTIITENWQDVHKHFEINPELVRQGVESNGWESDFHTFDTFDELQAWVNEKPKSRKTVFTKEQAKIIDY